MSLVGTFTEVEVWTDASGGSKINSADSWINGRYIRIYSGANSGNARSETIMVNVSDGGGFAIDVYQAGAPPTISTLAISPVTFSGTATGTNGGSQVSITGTIGGLTKTQTVYCYVMLDGVSVGWGSKPAVNGYFSFVVNTSTLYAGTYVVRITNTDV